MQFAMFAFIETRSQKEAQEGEDQTGGRGLQARQEQESLQDPSQTGLATHLAFIWRTIVFPPSNSPSFDSFVKKAKKKGRPVLVTRPVSLTSGEHFPHQEGQEGEGGGGGGSVEVVGGGEKG